LKRLSVVILAMVALAWAILAYANFAIFMVAGDPLELKPGTLQPGSTTQAQVATNATNIAQYQNGSLGISGGPPQGPYAETWPPIISVQEGSSSSPFHNAVGAAVWENPDLDLYNGSFNSHDMWWNAAAGYENICVIGGNNSGANLNNNHFYGITSVDFYANGSNITGPSRAVTATSAIGYPLPRIVTGGSVAGSSLATINISPSFPFAPSEKIHISGATGSSVAYNGDWLVAPPDPNGTYGQKVGTLTLSTVNGAASIPAGTPAPIGATVVSTEPVYWCVHVYPKDYPDGLNEFRAVVHYLNGWTSVLETVKTVDSLDTADNEGILFQHGSFGWSATQSQVAFLPQTNFGASNNTYDCLVPGVIYGALPPISVGNPYWGNVLPAQHWLGDDQLQLYVNQTYTVNSGSVIANGSVAQFQVPHTIGSANAPYLTNGSTVNTSFTIPSVTTTSITPGGTSATLASLSTAITVNDGDQVTVSGLTNPTYTVGSITVSGTTATATLSGTGSSDILAPTSTVAGNTVKITITGSSIGTVSSVTVTSASAGQVSWTTAASPGSYTGGTLSLTSGGGWNQRFNTGTNSSGTIVVQFPDGESYSVAPTGTATVLWNQDQQYRVASYSFNTTANHGANETITVVAPGGHNTTFVPGQVVYLTGLPNISFNDPTQSQGQTQSLNGMSVGGGTGTFATVVAAPSANTFTFYGPVIGVYNGYSVTGVSMAGTTETVTFTVPGVTGTQPTIPIGSHVNLLSPMVLSTGAFVPTLAASGVSVTASSPGSVSFTNASGAGTAAYGTLQVTDGTYANSWSGTIAVATPNPNERVTSDLSVQWVFGANAGIGIPTYPHPGVQLSSMTISGGTIGNPLSGTATAQYPTNLVTPTGMTITGTGNVKLVSFQHSVLGTISGGGPCQDSNIIMSPLSDGILSPMPWGTGQSPEIIQQWQSLWENISFNNNLYVPTTVIDNHQDSGDPNPNRFNITGITDNGNGTATATFVGNYVIPVGSQIFVSNSISADPNVDGFNTLAYPPQAIASTIAGTSVSFSASSGLTGCSGSPTVTLTYGGTANYFNGQWLKVEGLVNTASAPYTNNWNGLFQACNTAAGAVSYIVPPPLSGTPAWTGAGTVVAAPTAGVYPSLVTASSAASPNSTVTYNLPSPTNATTSAWVKGGTIDIVDCGQDGTNADACTTLDGALWSLHRTGIPNYLGSVQGIGYNMTLGSGGVETFSTTYNINGAWTVNGDGTCTFEVSMPGANFMPVGTQVDVTSGAINLLNEYIQSSSAVFNNPKITIACPGVVSATGGSVAWHSEYHVGMPLTALAGNISVVGNNIGLGVYPNQPYFVEATTAAPAGTPIAPGASFLLSATPGGPPLTASSSGTLQATQNLNDVQTVCLTGPSGSSTTPSSAQYYQLGNVADNGLIGYNNQFGWTMIGSCSSSNPHATIGQSAGQWGTGLKMVKLESIDLCAHTSLNSLPYCSLNDASVYGNTGFINAGGDWFDNNNLFGFSGYIAGGGPGSNPGGGRYGGFAFYITQQYTINNFYPVPIVSDAYTGSGVSDLEYINQAGQLSNWSLYDHAYFDGMPGSGYNNAFACGNSGAPGWPNIAGCSNPQGTLGTGIWTGGVGSGVKNPFGTCSGGGCDPVNTTGCNQSGTSYACNIIPLAQIQRDVQSLVSNAGSSYVPTAWTQSGGGPFLDYSTYSSAFNLQFTANPAQTAWVDYTEFGNGYGLLLTGANAGQVFFYTTAQAKNIDICSVDRMCFAACFDATLVNPFCPEGQSQFIAAGLDVEGTTATYNVKSWTGNGTTETVTLTLGYDVPLPATVTITGTTGGNVSGATITAASSGSISFSSTNSGSGGAAGTAALTGTGIYDPNHSTSGIQKNNIDTTSVPSIISKNALTCAALISGPALCNGTTNPNDTWEEVFPQTSSGAPASSLAIWNGAHLDDIFNKINPATWGDMVFNAIVSPLADPSCRVNNIQLYPIVCNAAVAFAFEELSYTGPLVMINSSGWVPGGAGYFNDNKYFKNDQFTNESFVNIAEDPQITVDTIYPQASSGRLFDNSTCWDGPSGQINGGHVFQTGAFSHPQIENGYSYLETLPATGLSVTGTTATLTFTGLPFTPLIPPDSLIQVSGLTGGLVNANTASNSNSVNAGNGVFYTPVTVGSTAGTVQFTVPSGMSGLSQTLGVVLDWPYALFFNGPSYGTVYSISNISWSGTTETITYTSPDNLPITASSTVSIAGATTPSLDFTGLTRVGTTNAGTIIVTNPALTGSGSESETSATATFSQACQW
jgi:hypothetical protein